MLTQFTSLLLERYILSNEREGIFFPQINLQLKIDENVL